MAVIQILLIHVMILMLVDGTGGLRCNSCSPYTSGRRYPECLHTSQTCNTGHVCNIIYKAGNLSSSLTMGCSTRCLQYPSSTSQRCTFGGKITKSNTCIKCCQSNSCVTRFRRAVAATSTTTLRPLTRSPLRLHCPSSCLDSQLDGCRSSGNICSNDQYCNMALNLQTGQMLSQCTSTYLQNTCFSYTNNHHCPFRLEDANAYRLNHNQLYGYCYYGCCSNNSCVDDILYPKPTTTIKPITTPAKTASTTKSTTTSTQPSTTPSTTTLRATTQKTSTPIVITTPVYSYNYSHLLTSCVDKLVGSACPTLRDLKSICKASVGATLCPVTCNICKTVKSIVCEDKTQTNDCTELSRNPNFCQSDMAIYTCPKSCNLCSELVKSVVDEILFASPTPDFNQPLTTPPTLHCPELLQSQCEHVRDVCNHSNLHDVCPKECGVCS